MYVRFVVPERDKYSEQKKGIFVVAYDLLRNGYLPNYEWWFLRRTLNVFVDWLPTPKEEDLKDRAIFWLRADLTHFAPAMRHLAGVVVRAGYSVEILSTTHPGYELYRDEFQVGAIPFRDTFERKIDDVLLRPWTSLL